MVEGTLIAESLRAGTTLEDLTLTIRKISRYRAQGTTPDQPDIWTVLDFEVDEAGAGKLAQALADDLDQPGWYVDFRSPAETFVVFPGRIFCYPWVTRPVADPAHHHDYPESLTYLRSPAPASECLRRCVTTTSRD